ncbi:hypothetical protein V5P93_003524 [Actinokineospora auranticolor]|uniref:Glycoside-hydrolase family GH114 TIM-barrel domain-containing protein n=1 Tax=Actinokineospora auranticolor TaxID=155976 RepID=A0A2S6GPR4_9PSEU|nr:hypothetical protein [Actinokineospora auranticolor]PPK67187.1 hypothetical protein CLV40_108184 [Actinokineospora auranticolor]
MRRLSLSLFALFAVVVGGLPPVAVAAPRVAEPANPLGLAYDNASGVAPYGKPTGMVVTGRCNRYDPAFAAARAGGAEVLAYLAPTERPDAPVCAADTAFYGGDLSKTALWPYPSYGQRVNWPKTHMTDIRAGLAWSNHVVAYIENLMREDKVDGVYLDVVGARTWSKLADWDSWSKSEQQLWTAGNVDLVRRLDASRRAINPRFIIVNNNIWDYAAGTAAERYVDGISLEHHKPTSEYHRALAARPYGNAGHRRVIAIAMNAAEARQWAAVPGVTHVSSQATYGTPPAPPVPFHRLTDRNR